ncbi:MAG: hypothetical protein H6Q56_1865, partial [Deltaproteobacteria bacterium]|nr:hypothetical protein [Deltaproteobacteria bacterium]
MIGIGPYTNAVSRLPVKLDFRAAQAHLLNGAGAMYRNPQETLLKVFGYQAFRHPQAEIVAGLINGE